MEVNKVCRLCLCAEGQLVWVFDQRFKSAEYMRNLILETTGVEINKEDAISQKICTKCGQDVIKLHQFREQSQENDKYLKDLQRQKMAKKTAVHTSVYQLYKTYPGLKLPDVSLHLNFSPVVEMEMDEVENYFKRRKIDMNKYVNQILKSERLHAKSKDVIRRPRLSISPKETVSPISIKFRQDKSSYEIVHKPSPPESDDGKLHNEILELMSADKHTDKLGNHRKRKNSDSQIPSPSKKRDQIQPIVIRRKSVDPINLHSEHNEYSPDGPKIEFSIASPLLAMPQVSSAVQQSPEIASNILMTSTNRPQISMSKNDVTTYKDITSLCNANTISKSNVQSLQTIPLNKPQPTINISQSNSPYFSLRPNTLTESVNRQSAEQTSVDGIEALNTTIAPTNIPPNIQHPLLRNMLTVNVDGQPLENINRCPNLMNINLNRSLHPAPYNRKTNTQMASGLLPGVHQHSVTSSVARPLNIQSSHPNNFAPEFQVQIQSNNTPRNQSLLPVEVYRSSIAQSQKTNNYRRISYDLYRRFVTNCSSDKPTAAQGTQPAHNDNSDIFEPPTRSKSVIRSHNVPINQSLEPTMPIPSFVGPSRPHLAPATQSRHRSSIGDRRISDQLLDRLENSEKSLQSLDIEPTPNNTPIIESSFTINSTLQSHNMSNNQSLHPIPSATSSVEYSHSSIELQTQPQRSTGNQNVNKTMSNDLLQSSNSNSFVNPILTFHSNTISNNQSLHPVAPSNTSLEPPRHIIRQNIDKGRSNDIVQRSKTPTQSHAHSNLNSIMTEPTSKVHSSLQSSNTEDNQSSSTHLGQELQPEHCLNQNTSKEQLHLATNSEMSKTTASNSSNNLNIQHLSISVEQSKDSLINCSSAASTTVISYENCETDSNTSLPNTSKGNVLKDQLNTKTKSVETLQTIDNETFIPTTLAQHLYEETTGDKLLKEPEVTSKELIFKKQLNGKEDEVASEDTTFREQLNTKTNSSTEHVQTTDNNVDVCTTSVQPSSFNKDTIGDTLQMEAEVISTKNMLKEQPNTKLENRAEITSKDSVIIEQPNTKTRKEVVVISKEGLNKKNDFEQPNTKIDSLTEPFQETVVPIAEVTSKENLKEQSNTKMGNKLEATSKDNVSIEQLNTKSKSISETSSETDNKTTVLTTSVEPLNCNQDINVSKSLKTVKITSKDNAFTKQLNTRNEKEVGVVSKESVFKEQIDPETSSNVKINMSKIEASSTVVSQTCEEQNTKSIKSSLVDEEDLNKGSSCEKEVKYPCTFCKRIFKSDNFLTNHLKVCVFRKAILYPTYVSLERVDLLKVRQKLRNAERKKRYMNIFKQNKYLMHSKPVYNINPIIQISNSAIDDTADSQEFLEQVLRIYQDFDKSDKNVQTKSIGDDPEVKEKIPVFKIEDLENYPLVHKHEGPPVEMQNLRSLMYMYKIPVFIKNGDKLTVSYKYDETIKPKTEFKGWEDLTLIDIKINKTAEICYRRNKKSDNVAEKIINTPELNSLKVENEVINLVFSETDDSLDNITFTTSNNNQRTEPTIIDAVGNENVSTENSSTLATKVTDLVSSDRNESVENMNVTASMNYSGINVVKETITTTEASSSTSDDKMIELVPEEILNSIENTSFTVPVVTDRRASTFDSTEHNITSAIIQHTNALRNNFKAIEAAESSKPAASATSQQSHIHVVNLNSLKYSEASSTDLEQTNSEVPKTQKPTEYVPTSNLSTDIIDADIDTEVLKEILSSVNTTLTKCDTANTPAISAVIPSETADISLPSDIDESIRQLWNAVSQPNALNVNNRSLPDLGLNLEDFDTYMDSDISNQISYDTSEKASVNEPVVNEPVQMSIDPNLPYMSPPIVNSFQNNSVNISAYPTNNTFTYPQNVTQVSDKRSPDPYNMDSVVTTNVPTNTTGYSNTSHEQHCTNYINFNVKVINQTTSRNSKQIVHPPVVQPSQSCYSQYRTQSRLPPPPYDSQHNLNYSKRKALSEKLFEHIPGSKHLPNEAFQYNTVTPNVYNINPSSNSSSNNYLVSQQLKNLRQFRPNNFSHPNTLARQQQQNMLHQQPNNLFCQQPTSLPFQIPTDWTTRQQTMLSRQQLHNLAPSLQPNNIPHHLPNRQTSDASLRLPNNLPPQQLNNLPQQLLNNLLNPQSNNLLYQQSNTFPTGYSTSVNPNYVQNRVQNSETRPKSRNNSTMNRTLVSDGHNLSDSCTSNPSSIRVRPISDLK